MHARPRSFLLFTRQPAVWIGLSIVGVMLLAGSGIALRYGTARAASITDTTCTPASYKADVAAPTGNDKITFDCASAATIDVPAGAGGPGTVTVTSGQTLTITSKGKPVTLSGSGSTQLFRVLFGGSGPGTLYLTDVTLTDGSESTGGAIYTNGAVIITSSTLSGNTSPGGGGALYEDDMGSVTITDSTLTANTAVGGYSSTGGAIYNAGGSLTVTDSTFSNNAATGRLGDSTTDDQGLPGHGGAIYSAGSSGTLTISGSAFSKNTATGGNGGPGGPGGPASGGAVDVTDGTVTISDSTLSGNSATGGAGGASGTPSAGGAGGDAGGGALNITPGPTVTISDSTFVGNNSTGGAGGPSSTSATPGGSTKVYGSGGSSFGGAINDSGGGVGLAVGTGTGSPNSGGGVGLVAVRASTLTTNSSTGGSGFGGAIDASGGGVGLAVGTGTGSGAVMMGTLADNVVYGNTASSGGSNCVSELTDDGYNLTNTGDTGCGFSAASHDVFTSSAGLGTLGDYGGTAPTIYLTKSSPAVDAIPPDSAPTPTGCGVTGGPLATDERGVKRPQGAGCDIGAYERAPGSDTHLTVNASSVVQGQSVQLCASVEGTVSGTSTPTGTVTFKDGSSTLGNGTLVGGSVCMSTSALGVGTHSITASYGGNPQFDPSVSAPVSVTVGVVGQDVAGTSAGGGNPSAPPSANTGATGSANGTDGSGQQSQSAASSGSGAIAGPSSPRGKPTLGGIRPAGLGLGLGALLLLVGISGLGVMLVRAARH